MGLFGPGKPTAGSTARAEATKQANQRRGQNKVTVSEVKCRSKAPASKGRIIFGAKPTPR